MMTFVAMKFHKIFFVFLIINVVSSTLYARRDSTLVVLPEIVNPVELNKNLTIPFKLKKPQKFEFENKWQAIGFFASNIALYEQNFSVKNSEKYLSKRVQFQDDYTLISGVLNRKNLPQWLGLIPFIMNENYHPYLFGFWPMSIVNANKYQVLVDSLVDFRYDIIASSSASADYLLELKKHFDSWPNTLAAFFCGAANVNAAVNRSKSNDLNDYFIYLPFKERSFLAAYFAVLNMEPLNDFAKIANQFYVEDRDLLSSYHFQFEIPLEIIVQRLGITFQNFYNNNPVIIGKKIPAGVRFFIPEKFSKLNEDSLKSWIEKQKIATEQKQEEQKRPEIKEEEMSIHTVKSGETLSQIAEKYGVGVSELKNWNNLKSDVIYVGQNIKLYPSSQIKETTQPKEEKAADTPKSQTSTEYKIYVVKSGDTLWAISQKFSGVTDEDLRKWNNLKNNNIQPGQKLKVYSK